MAMKINLDRGVVVSRQKVEQGGVYVYMYMDEPGIYLNEHGHKVSESFAASVGLDVAKYAKERIRRDKMAEYKKQVEAELALVDVETEVVLKEVNGFKLIELPAGRANVKDADGELINTTPIPLYDAEVLLKALTETDPDPAPKGKTKGA